MDIVSRLKIFMNSMNLTSTQFADTCRIPRPSLSQLLNGRNKKVSDEIVSKIHDSFPDLSVLWLLFGEGNMVTDSNIKISATQNNEFIKHSASNLIENQADTQHYHADDNYMDFNSNNFDLQSNSISSEKTAFSPQTIRQNSSTNNTHTSNQTNIPLPKRITNIVVFYDDNSFESFSPSM